MRHQRRNSRRGAVLVLLLVSLITLLTFVALAIDLGMLAVARTQCQDAADAAAMAGARTLNGMTATNNNYSAAAPNAHPGRHGQHGSDPSRFSRATSPSTWAATCTCQATSASKASFPGPSNENWSMVKATVGADVSNSLAFSQVFNFSGGNMQAAATAAHRPRDVAVILDYSGSMRFGSLVPGRSVLRATAGRTTPDHDRPTFGHYSATGRRGAAGHQLHVALRSRPT